MGHIKLLPPCVANQIAAGECIERPASVVKELIENSLDASATNIEVEIEDAGNRLIRVRDDGCGIEAEELPLALARHATSKLEELEDLSNLHTLGFRGEALASIASVSELSLASATQNSDKGYKIECKNCQLQPVRPVGMTRGTVVEVRNLFFNFPARRKFMKSASTEMAHITDTVVQLALSAPKVSWKLTHNGKLALSAMGTDDTAVRIQELLLTENIEFVKAEKQAGTYSLVAYLALPKYSRSSGKWQHCYVNRRYVKDRTALRALQDGYKDFMPANRFCIAVLYLDMDPSLLDVNVHPTKAEVRYRNSQEVFKLIYTAVLQRLNKCDLTNSIPWEKKNSSIVSESKAEFRPDVLADNLESQEATQNYNAGHAVLSESKPIEKNEGKNVLKTNKTPSPEIEGGCTHLSETPSPQMADTVNPMINSFNSCFPQYSSPHTQQEEKLQPFHPGSHQDTNSVTTIIQPEPILSRDKKEETSNQALAHLATISGAIPGGTGNGNGTMPGGDESRSEFVTGGKESQAEFDYSEGRLPTQLFKSGYLQIHDTYLIMETNEGVLIIDQHALHERVIYEKLRTQALRGNVVTQPLLFGEPIKLSAEDMALFLEWQTHLAKIGVEARQIGADTIEIKSLPQLLGRTPAAGLITEILDQIQKEAKVHIEDILDKMISMMACKAAIKAGDKLKKEEVLSLLRQTKDTENPFHCPHGRPTTLKITFQELEKYFKRR